MRRVISSVTLMVLAGCSGGGGGSNPPQPPPPPPEPATATGVFKDADVEGLTYQSGDQSGITGANAEFVHEVGEAVTFSVGGVTLGSAEGKSVLTPIDLVADGTADSDEVLNVVRFLLMLDADGDPSNGILIPEAVRTRAEEWNQVDFSSADLEAELEFIIADAKSASGGVHELPNVADAREHITATFYCVHSGGFRGTYGGNDSGWFGLMVTKDGLVMGFGGAENEDAAFSAAGFVDVAQGANFVTGETTTGATFSGSFGTPDDVSGSWSAEDGDSGTFSGNRVAGSIDAAYRFTGLFSAEELSPEPEFGIFALDVDGDNQVNGVAYSVLYDELLTVSGSVASSDLTASTSSGTTITGTLTRDTGAMSGEWNGSSGTFGTFFGTGCALR